jgi:hypothetical protein
MWDDLVCVKGTSKSLPAVSSEASLHFPLEVWENHPLADGRENLVERRHGMLSCVLIPSMQETFAHPSIFHVLASYSCRLAELEGAGVVACHLMVFLCTQNVHLGRVF